MTAQYRIESQEPTQGSLLLPSSTKEEYTDRELAVAVAVKSVADPSRQHVQVVHIASGEVVFQTTPPTPEGPVGNRPQ